MKHFYLTIASFVTLFASFSASAETICGMQKDHELSALRSEESAWTSLGKGTYVEGWVTPGIYAPASYTDPAPYAYEVEVMESTATPGIYKIVSPYTTENFPFLNKNASTTACDIIIDATDPDFVRIDAQNSGFVNTTLTVNFTDPFFICNAGSYFLGEGYDKDEIKQYGFASTLKDGVIEIVGPRFGKSAEQSAQGYQWQGDYNGRLTLPAGGAWKSLGKGTYVDGWVTPGIYAPASYTDPAPYAYEVEVMESTATPGIYKIVNPYTTAEFPFLDKNAANAACDIIIDATDPDFVRIDAQNSGFVNTTLTVNFTDPFFICNAGSYFLGEGYDKDEIKQYGFASTLKDGVIEIVGPRFGKSAEQSAQGYQWQGDYNGRLTLPVGDTPDPGTWTAIGEARYIDGFIFPGWYGDPENHGWNVVIEENSDQPGMYRLINPYAVVGNPMLSANSFEGNANILIDATDPDVVVITPQVSGFRGLTTGGVEKDYYIGNDAGILISDGVWTKDEIKQYLPNRCDKLADKIITISSPLFGFNAVNDFGYKWEGAGNQTLQYPAKICLPGFSGIEDVITDDNASPIYYNLQGIRVNDPAPGGVYIRHTGNKTEKMYIK